MSPDAHRCLVAALIATFFAGLYPDVTGFAWPWVLAPRQFTLGIVAGTDDASGAFRMIFPIIRLGIVVALVPVVLAWAGLAYLVRREPEPIARRSRTAIVGLVLAIVCVLGAVAAAAEPWLGTPAPPEGVRGLARTALFVAGAALLTTTPGRGAAWIAGSLVVVAEVVMVVAGLAFDRRGPPMSPAMLAGFAFTAGAYLLRGGAWVAVAAAAHRARPAPARGG